MNINYPLRHIEASVRMLGEEGEKCRDIKVNTHASLPHRLGMIYSIKVQRNKDEDTF